MENTDLKIEILLATMHQKDFAFLDKMNIQADVLVIYQCDEEKEEEIQYKGYRVRMISTKERGLSKSRNMALKNATGDICLIADDDVVYYDGLQEKIQKAFQEIKDADIITFCAKHVNEEGEDVKKVYEIKNTKRTKLTAGKSTSYEIAINRKKIRSKNIKFDENFGTGSGCFLHGEENIFLRDCISRGLKVYFCPEYILKVCVGNSTWFTGYDEKFFYDAGAIWQRSFGRMSIIYILVTVFRKRKLYQGRMSGFKVFQAMLQGRRKLIELEKGNINENIT